MDPVPEPRRLHLLEPRTRTLRESLLFIVGNPLSHTLSPAMHNGVIARRKLPLRYVAVELSPAPLPPFLLVVPAPPSRVPPRRPLRELPGGECHDPFQGGGGRPGGRAVRRGPVLRGGEPAPCPERTDPGRKHRRPGVSRRPRGAG